VARPPQSLPHSRPTGDLALASFRQNTLRLRLWRAAIHSDLCILLLIVVVSALLRTLINGQYGFHRD
jgi:hypothetical protein